MYSEKVSILDKEYEQRTNKNGKIVRFVCVSDTHSRHKWLTPLIPKGDVFIHCGDLTFQSYGGIKALRAFNEWMGGFEHKYKIVIGGNHDRMLPAMKYLDLQNNIFAHCNYLQNDVFVISEFDNLSIFGCPWSQTTSSDNSAFQRIDAAMCKIKNQKIDILVGHSNMTKLNRYKNGNKLTSAIMTAIEKSNVCIHLCGHFHERYGAKIKHNFFRNGHDLFIANCSSLNGQYLPCHEPIVFDVTL